MKRRGWKQSMVYYTVPACHVCNSNRSDTSFLAFLGVTPLAPLLDGERQSTDQAFTR